MAQIMPNLTVGNNNTSTTTFTGIISGNGSFIKTGTGNLALGGNNTFTGQTNITAGTLTVNSSLALQLSDVNYNVGDGNLAFGSTITSATFAELTTRATRISSSPTPAAPPRAWPSRKVTA